MKVKSNFMGNDTKIKANTIAMIDNNKGIPLDEYLGNLSDLNTSDKSNLVNAINEVNSDIVYDKTLTSDQSIIDVTDLDIIRDGGIYDIDLITFTESTDELVININDLTSNYYRTALAVYGSAEGNQTTATNYSSVSRIEGYLYLTSTDVPITTHMRVYLSKGLSTYYTLAYELTHQCTMDNRHALIHIGGMNNSHFDNLNKITFSIRSNSGKFLKGTRVIVKKVV